jgi:hypothetical protein
VALESLDTLAALGLDAGAVVEAAVVELPHLDRLVERAGHEVAAVGGEGNTVHAVLVALLAFSTLNENTGLGVPDAHALVQAAGGDEAVVGRDGNSGNAVFDLESKNTLVLLDVPEPDGAVAGAGSDVTAIRGEVKRIDVLLVTRELVEDALASDVPDLELR